MKNKRFVVLIALMLTLLSAFTLPANAGTNSADATRAALNRAIQELENTDVSRIDPSYLRLLELRNSLDNGTWGTTLYNSPRFGYTNGGYTNGGSSYWTTGSGSQSWYWDGANYYYYNPDGTRFVSGNAGSTPYYKDQNGNFYWFANNGTRQYANGTTSGTTASSKISGSGLGTRYNGYSLYNGLITPAQPSTADEEAAKIVASIISAYAGNVWSQTHQAGVAWCVLNHAGEPGNVQNVAYAYERSSNTVDNWNRNLVTLARDVIFRWRIEQETRCTSVGRVLPSQYSWMYSKGGEVSFMTASGSTQYWNWSMNTPYGT